MGINAIRDFFCCGFLVATSVGFPSTRLGEPPRVEIVVEQVERVTRNEVRFRLKVANRSDGPVFFNGIDYELLVGPNPEARPRPSETRLYPVYLEQWRKNEGWKVVGPCMDLPPPHVVKLNPGNVMAFDSTLALPLPSICKVRNIQLEGKFRFRLEYFESEKQARAYVEKLFSGRWKEARAPAAALSEPFEIPPPANP